MDPLAAKINEVSGLSGDIDVDLDGLEVAVLELTARLTTAVPSFVGLTVCLHGDAGDVTLTAVSDRGDRRSATSLGFSVPLVDGSTARLTLYAHQPGALVDLGADLSHLWRRDAGSRGVGARSANDIRLDQDLPAPVLVPGLTGLGDQATLNRAEGVLVDRGVDPDDSTAQLKNQAAAAGVDLHTYARRLLDALIDADHDGRPIV